MSESTAATRGALATSIREAPIVVASLWLNEWFAGQCAPDDLIDNAGIISIVDLSPGQRSSQELLLPWLRSKEIVTPTAAVARPLFPVPGDLMGLPGPRQLQAEALTAGRALVVDGPNIALVPGESGTWSCWTCATAAHYDLIRPETASSQMRSAIHDATHIVSEVPLDSPARDEVMESVAAIRTGLDRIQFPASVSGQRRETISRALFVTGLCQLVEPQLDRAPTAAASSQNRQALRELSALARRCLGAACATR